MADQERSIFMQTRCLQRLSRGGNFRGQSAAWLLLGMTLFLSGIMLLLKLQINVARQLERSLTPVVVLPVDDKEPAAVRPAALPLVPDDEFIGRNGLPAFLWRGKEHHNPGSIARIARDTNETETVRQTAILWLQEHLERVTVGSVEADLLRYDYDYPFDYELIPAGFASSWAQAEWTRTAARMFADDPGEESRLRYLRAACGFLIPQNKGGFMTRREDGIWFEELGNYHILNAQLDGLEVLFTAADELTSPVLREAADEGVQALIHRLPQYDTGNWSRYDLGWNRYEVMFTLTADSKLPSAHVVLHDVTAVTPRPDGTRSVSLGPCKANAWTGSCHLVRNAFSEITLQDGSKGLPVSHPRFFPLPEDDGYGLTGRLVFAMTFPDPDTQDPLDAPEPQISLDFTDLAAGNLALEVRDRSYPLEYSFKPVASLITTGDGKRKQVELTLPRTIFDRGIAERYQWKHVRGLEWLASRTKHPDLAKWARVFHSYLQTGRPHDRAVVPRGRWMKILPSSLRQRSGKDGRSKIRPSQTGGSQFVLQPGDSLDMYFNYYVRLGGFGFSALPESFTMEIRLDGHLHFSGQFPAGRDVWYSFPNPVMLRNLTITIFAEKTVQIRGLRAIGDSDFVVIQKLRTQLGGGPGLHSLQQILQLGKNFKERFQLGVCPSSDPAEMIEAGVMQCGERQFLFCRMLEEMFIPARAVDLHNYPQTGEGHCAMEFWWQGKWRYYDPSYTFHVQPEGMEGPVSFAELRQHPEWADLHGRWQLGEPWPPGNRPGYVDGHEYMNAATFTAAGIFRQAEPAGPTEAFQPLLFTVDIPADGWRLGDVSSPADYSSHLDCCNGQGRSGIPAGLNRLGRVDKAWEIAMRFPPVSKSIQKWRVRLTAATASGANLFLRVEPSTGGTVIPSRQSIPFVGIRPREQGAMEFVFTSPHGEATLKFSLESSVYPADLTVDAWEVIPLE